MKKIIFLFLLFTCFIREVNAQTFNNPSFETWGLPNSCEINTVPDGWSSYTTAGLDPDEGNYLLCPTAIPGSASNGNVYARCVSFPIGGEGMYQMVSGFGVGGNYPITFDYAGSDLFGGTDAIQWHLFIDDVDVDQTPVFQSTDTIWTTHTYIFSPTLPTHKIGVRLFLTTGSAGSGGIDNFHSADFNGVESYLPDLNNLVFPNPALENITITTEPKSEIEILNIEGQIIKSITANENNTSLDISAFAKGMYFVKVKTENGIRVKKFIKE